MKGLFRNSRELYSCFSKSRHNVSAVCAQHRFYAQASVLVTPQRVTRITMRRNGDANDDSSLRYEKITFNTKAGEEIEVDAVVQDTLPSGSEVGTVVTVHGSPGSHKDFKYVTPHLEKKGIRVVGINFPAYGLTSGDDDKRLKFDNTERNNFITSVVKKLDLHDAVFMGHSRGCEQAIQSCAMNKDRAAGLLLFNPTGLEYHRGLRPFWIVVFALWLYDLGGIMPRILEPMLKFLYDKLGLRLDSGKRAVTCMRTMVNLELAAGLLPAIKSLNEDTSIHAVIGYAEKDFLVETRISHDLAKSFVDHEHLVCDCKTDDGNERVTQQTLDLINSGRRSVSVNFVKEGHFLQKFRGEFAAATIEAMLRVHKKDKQSSTSSSQ